MNRIVWLLIAALLIPAATVMAQEASELAGAEQQAMADTLQHALEYNPSNQAADWVNPDTGRSGAVVPMRTYENAQGQPCREFTTTIIIGDREEQGYGTACRQPDGSWQLVGEANQPPPAVSTSPSTSLSSSSVTIYEPPPVYYGFPSGFYGPYSIYLSFNSVYRSGHVHYGFRYLDGPTFRHRYPVRVKRYVDYGPRIIYRYRLDDEWRYRDWERHRDRHDDRDRRHEYRDDSRRRSGKYDDRRSRYDDGRRDRDHDRGRGRDRD